MSLTDTRVAVLLLSSHHKLIFHWTEKTFYILHDIQKAGGPRHTRTHDVSHHNLLRVAFDSRARTLSVAYLKPKTKKKRGLLVVLNGTVQDISDQAVESWAEAVMQSLYEDRGIKRARRLLVFVNPHGGVGRGVEIFSKIVAPIFRASGCITTVVETERHGHAFEHVKTLPLLDHDAIATVSGDGLIHEVLNGLAQHAEPIKALNTPLAPIPAGSGNGLALNLMGLENGFDSATAALNIIKGLPMKADLFSVSQGGKRSLSFMSQSLGLMADLDLDTEHLRWIGDARFMYGFLRGIIAFDPCPIQVSVKLAEKDKDVMAKLYNARADGNIPHTPADIETPEDSSVLPPLKHFLDDNGGWFTINEPILSFYAGQGPYVGRDYMAFPVSLPDDGLIDISIIPLTSRGRIISTISGAETGENFWSSQLQYFKAHAYRVKPLSGKGNLSVDGERFPFEEFQVEVHPRLGTFLSCHGRFAVSGLKPRPDSQK